jgi:hypothetical protein
VRRSEGLMRQSIDATSTPWPQYAEAVVELILDGRHLVLTPTPFTVPALAPARGGSARALSRWRPPIWVLTAGDPYPLELTGAENAAREKVLIAELDAAGIEHDPALGRSPDGSTSEVSRALRGIDRARALAIAARHGQLAVYEIDEDIRCIDVASGTVVTTRAFVLREAEAGSEDLVGPTGWAG